MITEARIDSYRRSWFPTGARHDYQRQSRAERAQLFWHALGSPSLTASAYDERAEIFRAVVHGKPFCPSLAASEARSDARAALGSALLAPHLRRTLDVAIARGELRTLLEGNA